MYRRMVGTGSCQGHLLPQVIMEIGRQIHLVLYKGDQANRHQRSSGKLAETGGSRIERVQKTIENRRSDERYGGRYYML